MIYKTIDMPFINKPMLTFFYSVPTAWT